MSGLTVEEVPGAAAFEELGPEWTDLWLHAPTATPFQSPAWLIPWSRHFGTAETITLVLRRAGCLVGVMPLFVWAREGRRTVFPGGIGVSDYLDGTFAAGEEEACGAAVLDWLTADPARWDALEFQELRPESPLLTAAANPEWTDSRGPQSLSPVLALAAPDPLSAVPRGMRGNLRYYRNRASKLGSLRTETATEKTVPDLLDGLGRLHRRRWSKVGQDGMMADTALRELHRQAAMGFSALGVLRLYAMYLDERMIAALYGFLFQSRFYFYLSGFDPDLAELSPGTLILGHAVQEAGREGATGFDFLRGPESYKHLWGAIDQPTYLRRLERPK